MFRLEELSNSTSSEPFPLTILEDNGLRNDAVGELVAVRLDAILLDVVVFCCNNLRDGRVVSRSLKRVGLTESVMDRPGPLERSAVVY